MKKNHLSTHVLAAVLYLVMLSASALYAQRYTPTPNDTLKSVTVLGDGKVSFKFYAPQAKTVTLGGTDIPEKSKNNPMKSLGNGVWETIVEPLEPGAYRYEFVMDDIRVTDPKNPLTSEANMNTWSLMYLPGADFMDTKNVPHGAVSEITYYSSVLSKFRRMHVYTPPGYEAGSDKYPVFYLLHGAFDSDDSWTTVGRAGFIFDNLLAEGKMVPMVVVMPAGHTGPFDFSAFRDPSKIGRDLFVDEFASDIKPYIEKNYRTYTDRKNRAIAGLSMGGAHTLNIAIPHLDEYAYFGVYSSGVFGIGSPAPGPSWEEQNSKTLGNAELKKGLQLVWFATGTEDFLLSTSRATVEMLKKNGFAVTYKETAGGHTWKNWREYLNEFAPMLFKQK